MESARGELRLAFDTIPALVWTTLPDGTGELSNARWLEFTGLSSKEAEGWGYASALHPEDYERLRPKWAASFLSGEPIEDEARLRRADGAYRWFLHRAVPLRDEQAGSSGGTAPASISRSQRPRRRCGGRGPTCSISTHDTVFA